MGLPSRSLWAALPALSVFMPPCGGAVMAQEVELIIYWQAYGRS